MTICTKRRSNDTTNEILEKRAKAAEEHPFVFFIALI